MSRSVVCIAAFLLVVGCKDIRSLISSSSPYVEYAKSLERAGLSKASLCQSWKEAGEQAFTDSILVALPFSEAAYVQASKPRAHAYLFDVDMANQ